MKTIYVFMYLPGEVTAVPVGIFRLDEKKETGYFAYGKKFLLNHNQSISPNLPQSDIQINTQMYGGLFSSFRDSLPDYWGRLVYSSINKLPIELISNIDLLLSGGASRIGNLDFRLSVNDPEPILELPGFSSLKDIIEATKIIQAGGEVDKAYKQLLQQGTSNIGGMRPKCTIEMDNHLWIAKFSSIGDQYDMAKIEAATMELARLSGIQVPEIKVKQINGKSVFLIKRFDREYSQEKQGYLRTGYISGLSLLEKEEMDRDFGYPDFAEKLRLLGDHSGSKALFKRMVFNIAVKNLDDHAKNHGFIWTNNTLKLSPAFDITPTPSIEGLSTEFDLAINIGQQGRSATISNALSSYSRFGLLENEAIDSITEVMNAVSQWESVFQQFEVSEDDRQRFAYTMESAKQRLTIPSNADEDRFRWT